MNVFKFMNDDNTSFFCGASANHSGSKYVTILCGDVIAVSHVVARVLATAMFHTSIYLKMGL